MPNNAGNKITCDDDDGLADAGIGHLLGVESISMATNYERGRNYEYRSMGVLASAGYETARAAGSHGCWDVAGFSAGGICLVQVKFNCRPSLAEIEQFKLYPCPPNTIKLIHEWRKGARAPLVTVL